MDDDYGYEDYGYDDYGYDDYGYEDYGYDDYGYDSGGGQTFTFDDGSTLTVDASGNVVSSTEATDTTQDSSGLAKVFADVAKSLGLKSPTQLAALAGAAGSGLSALLNKGGGQRPTGYMGGIPSYTAVREQVPYAADSARRPGSAGRQYFTDVKYVSPTDAATAQAAAKQEAEGIAGLQQPVRAAAGGLMGLKSGRYLNGATDGMADEVPAKIEDSQEARLSHGEFVIPADVVSHIGNGNSEAGAKRLYDMMARLRKARTGTPRQGKKINPDKFMPA